MTEPMILEDFLYIDTNGLYCKYGNFYIDPKQPVNIAVISHAHADHAVPGNNEIYCTEATTAFMKLRYAKNAGKVFNIGAYDKTFELRGVQITLIHAGSMLRSAQISMEEQEV